VIFAAAIRTKSQQKISLRWKQNMAATMQVFVSSGFGTAQNDTF